VQVTWRTMNDKWDANDAPSVYIASHSPMKP
jgi:hypothetical protein